MKSIKCFRLHAEAILPSYSHDTDAGMDLFSCEEVVLSPGEWKKIGCGFQLEIPPGYLGAVAPRSGLAYKNGVTVLNSWGVIDSGYRGEICVILINHGYNVIVLPKQSRIAQFIVLPFEKVNLVESSTSLAESDRGQNGFGSTGI
ncbi:MAG: dUTP diphosphatase [Caldisericia bacterium]|nr:dUTP diphosphatase [Caldisericia bacterium]